MHTIITAKDNKTIKHVQNLLTSHRSRKKSLQTVIEGVHLLDTYLKQKLLVDLVIVSEKSHYHHEVMDLLTKIDNKKILIVSESLYKNIRTLGDGVDVMAVIPISVPKFGDINQDCLILDGLQDAGNIGTLLRTASAIGINTIISTPNTAYLWSPKCLRAGMGAQFSLQIFEQISVDEILQAVKIPLFATSSHTQKTIYDYDLTKKIAWVLGHEGQGVCQDFLQKSNLVTLPQPNGQESLNVAVAGSVCFYEMLRQRQFN